MEQLLMRLADLPFPVAHQLSSVQALYRVQSATPRPMLADCGPVRLYAGPGRHGRFDLSEGLSAYFATLPQTAMHEAVFRKDLKEMSVDTLRERELIAVRLMRSLRVADIRPYASFLPVLQSVRQTETRELADDAFQQGFAGLISRSAQQGEHDCVVLFDPSPDLFRLLWRSLLSDRSGHGARWATVADRGARIPLKTPHPPLDGPLSCPTLPSHP